MSAPAYTNADFLAALQKLMPPGRVWPRDPAAVQTAFLSGLAPSFQRSAAAANQLLADAFPATANGIPLPNWEATLGLPDPCAGPAPSLPQRQAQVLARFVGLGGSSVPFFTQYAATLGYTITITEYTPYTVKSPVNAPMCGPQWAHAWLVNAPAGSNTVLQCEFETLAPAHTVVGFNFF